MAPRVSKLSVGGADGDGPLAPPLYGDKPTFTYHPKDGGDPIIFPAHSTITGEVGGEKFLEFFWRMEEDELSPTDQMFAYLRRSGATREMKRRVVRLEDEANQFFDAWVHADDEPPPTGGGLPPES